MSPASSTASKHGACWSAAPPRRIAGSSNWPSRTPVSPCSAEWKPSCLRPLHPTHARLPTLSDCVTCYACSLISCVRACPLAWTTDRKRTNRDALLLDSLLLSTLVLVGSERTVIVRPPHPACHPAGRSLPTT